MSGTTYNSRWEALLWTSTGSLLCAISTAVSDACFAFFFQG